MTDVRADVEISIDDNVGRGDEHHCRGDDVFSVMIVLNATLKTSAASTIMHGARFLFLFLVRFGKNGGNVGYLNSYVFYLSDDRYDTVTIIFLTPTCSALNLPNATTISSSADVKSATTMRISLPTRLLIACLIPSLASAWCVGGIASGVGLGVGSVIRGSCCGGGGDRLARPHRRHHARGDCSNNHHPRSRPIYAFELWSKTNDDDYDDKTDDDDGTGGGQMTPAKASKLLSTFWSMAYPYYRESKPGRRLFYGMILLTFVNSAVSVAFSYISKDFWNALSSKDAAEFYVMMTKFAAALIIGAPVSVLYR